MVAMLMWPEHPGDLAVLHVVEGEEGDREVGEEPVEPLLVVRVQAPAGHPEAHRAGGVRSIDSTVTGSRSLKFASRLIATSVTVAGSTASCGPRRRTPSRSPCTRAGRSQPGSSPGAGRRAGPGLGDPGRGELAPLGVDLVAGRAGQDQLVHAGQQRADAVAHLGEGGLARRHAEQPVEADVALRSADGSGS